jgi:hypothetical protein
MSNQIWKNEKIFSSYEEAKTFLQQLQYTPEGAIMQYKIKRNKNQFCVKSRTDPSLIDAINEIDKKIKKK